MLKYVHELGQTAGLKENDAWSQPEGWQVEKLGLDASLVKKVVVVGLIVLVGNSVEKTAKRDAQDAG